MLRTRIGYWLRLKRSDGSLPSHLAILLDARTQIRVYDFGLDGDRYLLLLAAGGILPQIPNASRSLRSETSFRIWNANPNIIAVRENHTTQLRLRAIYNEQAHICSGNCKRLIN